MGEILPWPHGSILFTFDDDHFRPLVRPNTIATNQNPQVHQQ
jgi:hypothetical protein